MAEITDLGEVRHKQKKKRFLRGILIILAILVVTFLVSSVVNSKNYTGAESFFNLFQSGSGYPIDAPGGKTRGMYPLDGLLVVVNDTDLIMYNDRGGKAFQVKHQMADPTVHTNGSMMLMVDQGSKSYALYHKNSPVVDSKSDHVIYTGATSQKAGFAIATRSDDYLSQVTVYNKSNQAQYSWNYADKIVTNLALSPSGDRLAVCGIFTEEGVIKSQLLLYYKGELVNTRDFDDALMCSIQFDGENHIRGVTDQGAFLISDKGKLLGEYDYKAQPLAAYYNSPQATVLLLGDYRQMGGYHMVALTEEMTRMSTSDIKGNVHQLKADSSNAYILAGNQYYQIDLATGQHLVEEESEYLYDLQPVGRGVYAITNEQIVRMAQAQAEKRQNENDIVPDQEKPAAGEDENTENLPEEGQPEEGTLPEEEIPSPEEPETPDGEEEPSQPTGTPADEPGL